MATLVHASSAADLGEARALFEEYARSLDFDLAFQSFAAELDELPGRYAPPSGRLLLLRVGATGAGCVALRQIGETTCEMKRLYVRPSFHGQGLGRRLVTAIVSEARDAGYAAMRLDTAPTMTAALSLYAAAGFVDIPPYTPNPIPGARFLELRL